MVSAAAALSGFPRFVRPCVSRISRRCPGACGARLAAGQQLVTLEIAKGSFQAYCLDCAEARVPGSRDLVAGPQLTLVPEEAPQLSWEAVTPEMATIWLSEDHKYAGQRNVTVRKVNQYTTDMAAGRWRWSPDAIAFDTKGRLLNGQHRLGAVVESGATIYCIIARGFPEVAYDAMDTGKSRSFADLLRSKGVDNAGLLSSAVGHLNSWLATGEFYRSNQTLRAVNSIPQLDALWERNPDLIQRALVDDARRLGRTFGFPRAVLLVTLYLFDIADTEGARDGFVQAVCTGAGGPEDPTFLLYRMLKNRQLTAEYKRWPNERYLKYLIKAYNLHARGQTSGNGLRLDKGEAPPIFDPNGLLDAYRAEELTYPGMGEVTSPRERERV